MEYEEALKIAMVVLEPRERPFDPSSRKDGIIDVALHEKTMKVCAPSVQIGGNKFLTQDVASILNKMLDEARRNGAEIPDDVVARVDPCSDYKVSIVRNAKDPTISKEVIGVVVSALESAIKAKQEEIRAAGEQTLRQMIDTSKTYVDPQTKYGAVVASDKVKQPPQVS